MGSGLALALTQLPIQVPSVPMAGGSTPPALCTQRRTQRRTHKREDPEENPKEDPEEDLEEDHRGGPRGGPRGGRTQRRTTELGSAEGFYHPHPALARRPNPPASAGVGLGLRKGRPSQVSGFPRELSTGLGAGRGSLTTSSPARQCP